MLDGPPQERARVGRCAGVPRPTRGRQVPDLRATPPPAPGPRQLDEPSHPSAAPYDTGWNQAIVYITGNGHDPQTGTFTDAAHAEDDGYTPAAENVVNSAGDVHIFVSTDGSSYKVVTADGGWREFSAVDSVNLREE